MRAFLWLLRSDFLFDALLDGCSPPERTDVGWNMEYRVISIPVDSAQRTESTCLSVPFWSSLFFTLSWLVLSHDGSITPLFTSLVREASHLQS